MNKLLGILVGLALLAGSCPSKTGEHSHPAAEHEATATGPVADLEKQVLATHDSMMPQMSELMRLEKAVSVHLKKTSDEAEKKRGMAIREQLDGADQLMMDWMHEYNGDTLKKLDQTKALAYLREQQTKVNTVRDTMRKRMAEAKRYLD